MKFAIVRNVQKTAFSFMKLSEMCILYFDVPLLTMLSSDRPGSEVFYFLFEVFEIMLKYLILFVKFIAYAYF
jgi:hypothetical protein